jgi:hypothetical protein
MVPIRVRCFGASSVWYGDQRLEITDTELLLLLGPAPDQWDQERGRH